VACRGRGGWYQRRLLDRHRFEVDLKIEVLVQRHPVRLRDVSRRGDFNAVLVGAVGGHHEHVVGSERARVDAHLGVRRVGDDVEVDAR
jgi:hypothetical protein